MKGGGSGGLGWGPDVSSAASSLGAVRLASPVGSMRPPPVHFPAGHCGGGPTQKFGRCVAVLRLVWSLHAAATSATTAPAPEVHSNQGFLSLHMMFASGSEGFADADPVALQSKRNAKITGRRRLLCEPRLASLSRGRSRRAASVLCRTLTRDCTKRPAGLTTQQ